MHSNNNYCPSDGAGHIPFYVILFRFKDDPPNAYYQVLYKYPASGIDGTVKLFYQNFNAHLLNLRMENCEYSSVMEGRLYEQLVLNSGIKVTPWNIWDHHILPNHS